MRGAEKPSKQMEKAWRSGPPTGGGWEPTPRSMERMSFKTRKRKRFIRRHQRQRGSSDQLFKEMIKSRETARKPARSQSE